MTSPATFRKSLFMQKYLPILPMLLLCSCYYARPVAIQQTENNKDYKVDYLFEHDGCKVYRFYDRGNYIYFTNCNGETIAQTDSTAIRNSIQVALKKTKGNP
jgi:hypothetical protein